jgi:hypothetical protein
MLGFVVVVQNNCICLFYRQPKKIDKSMHVHLVKGELAWEIKEAMGARIKPVAPRMFKSKLANFAPQ